MERIGRYKILDEVGRGAMGIVYRAQDPAIGRTVAIKTIRLSDFADSAERAKLHDRLFREAQSAGMLSHPGIVTIYDIAEEGDVAYITMEFVDGPTLDRMAVTDPPGGGLVLSILRQTAAALDYAHTRGIVHRDIKPANVMIHERTTAKITDFGVARIQSHQMTQAGSLVGTPNYMSPEQIQGQAVTGASDQFSLAVIAYELLTGEKPFTGDSMPALVFKIVQEDPVAAQRLNHTLGWTVDTVLKRALSKKAPERYATCSDFILALENACRGSKSWTPIPPGVLTDLPTVAPALTAATISPTIQADEPAPADEPVPRLLRIARAVALVVVGAGIVAALSIGAFQYFSEDLGEPAQVRDETELPADGPSPVAPPAVEPPAASKPALPAEEEPAPERQPALTRFTTNPPGAFLVVDGKSALSCVSPCTLPLSPGRHTLSATKEGHRRTLKILRTIKEEEVFLTLDRASGTVFVRSEPRGAAIYVDGQLRSEQTPAMLALPSGLHSIEVVRNGSRETRQVVVTDSVITNLSIDLNSP